MYLRLAILLSILLAVLAPGCGGGHQSDGDGDSDGDGEPGSYVVLAGTGEGDRYHEAAEALAAFRGGEVVTFDPADVEAVEADLAGRRARYVAVVVRPEDMDVNLVRRVLLMSTRMDDDPFCDFAFGFITGATGDEAVDLVERIIAFEELPMRWTKASVISEGGSYTFPTTDPVGAGFSGSAIYWAIVEDDPAVLDFVHAHIGDLSGGGVVSFGGCGDPEGIWLFDDSRNLDPSKHWPFDPDLVGQDPEGEMPRILAADLAPVDLSDSVVWSGVCHNGAVRRVFVEGDIVSTFGTVEDVTEYDIPPGRSVALTVLSNGALAFMPAIGPNHGFRTLIEQTYALETGLPLGDVMRMAYHDMVMASGGDFSISIGLYEAGAPMGSDTPDSRFWSSPHNRLLYGDPLFAPFRGQEDRAYRTTIEAAESGDRYRVRCAVENHWVFSLAWNMLASGDDDRRLYSTVELPEGLGNHRIEAVSLVDAGGHDVPITSSEFLVEEIDGRRVLHFQVTSGSTALEEIGTVLTFEVVRQ